MTIEDAYAALARFHCGHMAYVREYRCTPHEAYVNVYFLYAAKRALFGFRFFTNPDGTPAWFYGDIWLHEREQAEEFVFVKPAGS